MIEGTSFFASLATREGFNSSVRHINATLDLLDSCSPKNNIADEINKLLVDKVLADDGTQSAINMLLVQKAKYRARSRNLASLTADAANFIKEVSSWKALDLVVGYHHPDLGFLVINPKNPENQAIIEGFRKNELVVVYAGSEKQKPEDQKLFDSAIQAFLDLLEGNKAKVPSGLETGPYAFAAPKKKAEPKALKKSPASKNKSKKQVQASAAPAVTAPPPAGIPVSPPPAPVASTGPKKMSSLVSVVVTNELFHNGNVEAWKRIIRSYNARYPSLQVYIYYDGERIVDINTLFKWGKVKHGSCIQFCVSGENIQDLAKLSRYFRQGASPQFEAFLHGSPDTVMNLF